MLNVANRLVNLMGGLVQHREDWLVAFLGECTLIDEKMTYLPLSNALAVSKGDPYCGRH